MKLKGILILLLAGSMACTASMSFKRDREQFEQSKVIRSFTSIADMNDAHFDIRENNYFEFYRQLFDSIKNSSYPGRYSLRGDTMLLEFYDRKGETILGKKALINESKQAIIFLTN